MSMDLPSSWKSLLAAELTKDYFHELQEFVHSERATHDVFPHTENVFEAMKLTPPDKVRVLILGQDPYHGSGQAHGLSFSVMPGVKIPPSLRNIFKELNTDLGCAISESGSLKRWANEGVLLLNTVLTVRANEANSHRKKGWERFTDQVIRVVDQFPQDIAFILWGKPAQAKRNLIDTNRHFIIESPHPSPLSAHRGFLGSKPFSKVNKFFVSHNQREIDWKLTENV